MTALNKIMTPKQLSVAKDIREKKPRHIILEGAVRSGKTYEGILIWDTFISKYKNQNVLFIMTGQTISSLKRNVLDDWSKMFGHQIHLNTNNEFKLYGNRIACFGSDKSDSYKSMRGLTAQGWYANEVILSHQNTVLEAFARCSADGARIIWETNPDKPSHYIKTNYINRSGQLMTDGSYDIMSYHFSIDDNIHLDAKYVESLKASIPRGSVYDRQILGLWKATEKAIYNNFDIVPRDHQTPNDVYYGIDFGFNAPSALVKIAEFDNELWITGMLYKSKLTNNELVDAVKPIVGDRPLYCDTAEPDKIEDLKRAGINARPAIKKVWEGILKVKEYKLHLVNTDVNLIREFENYEAKTNSQGIVLDEPIKHDDHYCDAVRYAIVTHNENRIDEEDELIYTECIQDEFEY
jgi:PBSX family phage terminase large subunit